MGRNGMGKTTLLNVIDCGWGAERYRSICDMKRRRAEHGGAAASPRREAPASCSLTVVENRMRAPRATRAALDAGAHLRAVPARRAAASLGNQLPAASSRAHIGRALIPTD